MRFLHPKTANHLLYQTMLISLCYPERYFGRNQLLSCSMSLSPLYPILTSDLHVSTVLRSSIKVSFDFDQIKYRSQPFGSQRLCSIRVWPVLSVLVTFIAQFLIWSVLTCISVELLSPCFKTGHDTCRLVQKSRPFVLWARPRLQLLPIPKVSRVVAWAKSFVKE